MRALANAAICKDTLSEGNVDNFIININIYIMEYLTGIIDNTINSFDFGLVVSINIATYLIIKLIDEINGDKKVNIWVKRLVMILCSVALSVFYHFIDASEDKLIINSIILAPVFWSWIGKPIVTKFKVDYKNEGDD